MADDTTPSQPTIGILITYHNEGPLLTACLESIAAGSSQPDQIWIYDDASTVRPEAFIPETVRVRILRGDVNRGPAYGRNQMLRACECDYLHFHDSDDLFEPSWCATVRRAAECGAPEAIFTAVTWVEEAGGREETNVAEMERLRQAGDFLGHAISAGLLVPSGTHLRNRVLDIGGYDPTWWQSEDYDFHLRLAGRADRVVVIPVPLVRILLRARGRSKDYSRVWIDGLHILLQARSWIPAKYAGVVSEKLASMGSILFHLGEREEAKLAFTEALKKGTPAFAGRPSGYRTLARICGPMFAEYTGLAYRGAKSLLRPPWEPRAQ